MPRRQKAQSAQSTDFAVTADVPGLDEPLCLSTRAARNIATTTKTRPQMRGITSRWLLRLLPWVEVTGGTYRVNQAVPAGHGMVSGHDERAELPSSHMAYEEDPREYGLSVTQTVLNVHTRVADLYSDPMNQLDEQIRLTVQAVREQQEHEMVNNPTFGLLTHAGSQQRITVAGGPPTQDDLDILITARRGTQYLLAHPEVIAAFGRQCTRRGISPDVVECLGTRALGWRGIPLLPCSKIPISDQRTSPVIALRTGEDNEGVIGLHQTNLPDEYEPSLNVRFMGIDKRAVMSYLISAYYSLAVLVPDAVGVLEGISIHDEVTKR
ncbi:hypothetical protein [Streptomyces sp. NPDC014733]|uniref:hypothetical protein n=1 Tax=Streptomyces sp. NPDC014733 TaxID=3364885 RepID=UPI0036F9495D